MDDISIQVMVEDSRISGLDEGETGRGVEACKQVKALSTFVFFLNSEEIIQL